MEVVDIDFSVESAHASLSTSADPERGNGFTLHYELTLKPKSKLFFLKNGVSIRDCLLSIVLLPFSQRNIEFEDSRVGEIHEAIFDHEPPFLSAVAVIPDDQFSVLLDQASKSNLPQNIALMIGEDDQYSSCLQDGIWDNSELMSRLAIWEILFTVGFDGRAKEQPGCT